MGVMRKLTPASVTLCFLAGLFLPQPTAVSGEPSRWIEAGTRPAFPGGGTIMFLPANGTGLGEADIGLVSSNGSLHGVIFPQGRYGPGFEAWDPADPERILAGPIRHADLGRFGVESDSLHRLRTWRTTPYFQGVQYSPDGHTMAWKQRERGPLQLLSLGNGRTRTVDAPVGYLDGWIDSRRVLIDGPHDRRFAVNVRTGHGSLFLGRARVAGALHEWGRFFIGNVSFSPDGSHFAAVLQSMEHRRVAIAVGTSAGRIQHVVRLGHGYVSMTTWSPDGSAFAFAVSEPAKFQDQARAAVFDLRSSSETEIAPGAAPYWPPAWSPDGRWLLVDDDTNQRWVFASRDGTRTQSYPHLGGYPRWGGVGYASPSVNVHIPYC
jgi:hypothetical protein